MNTRILKVAACGADVLPDDQKLVIETARVIRVGFLQQNAFHADDTYVPMEKQREMAKDQKRSNAPVLLFLDEESTHDD